MHRKGFRLSDHVPLTMQTPILPANIRNGGSCMPTPRQISQAQRHPPDIQSRWIRLSGGFSAHDAASNGDIFSALTRLRIKKTG